MQKGIFTLIWKDTCIPMLIAALFTVAKIWKQPQGPSTNKLMKKMDLEGIMLNEISLIIMMYDITYMWNLKSTTNQ